VTYLRPTPLDLPVTLRARITESGPKKALLQCSLYSNPDECARGQVVAVRVPNNWRNNQE